MKIFSNYIFHLKKINYYIFIHHNLVKMNNNLEKTMKKFSFLNNITNHKTSNLRKPKLDDNDLKNSEGNLMNFKKRLQKE